MSMERMLILALLFASGCAYNPPPVVVFAAPADLHGLVGKWTGEYESRSTGRSGSIVFALAAGEDHAHGDVVMIPRGFHRSYQSWPEPMDRRAPALGELSDVLTIRFVTTESGDVSGMLDPYRDPDCDCRAETRFRGRLRGDAIEGTFTTSTAATTVTTSGTWRVRRKPS